MEWLLKAEMIDHETVLGFLAANPAAWSNRPQHSRFTGRACFAAAASARLIPGSAGSVATSWFSMIRMPTVPLVAAQSAIVSATPGSSCRPA